MIRHIEAGRNVHWWPVSLGQVTGHQCVTRHIEAGRNVTLVARYSGSSHRPPMCDKTHRGG